MPSIRIKAVSNGETTEVQALIQHPMESGYNKGAAGNPIPAHYIETLVFAYNGKPVFTALWGPGVAKDPYVKFAFNGGAKGDTVTATWADNFAATDSVTAKVG